MTPIAFGVPGLQVLYLGPLALAVWLVRTRTVVGPETMVACRICGSRRIAWSDLVGLRIDDRSRVSAVLRAGDDVPLPTVRARDLPVLVALSRGRLPESLAEAGERPTSEQ
jgi:hypothetical protein